MALEKAVVLALPTNCGYRINRCSRIVQQSRMLTAPPTIKKMIRVTKNVGERVVN